jgi:hypothetical protein
MVKILNSTLSDTRIKKLIQTNGCKSLKSKIAKLYSENSEYPKDILPKNRQNP